ncbi:MAG: phage baseplate assembly protein V [Clostridiales Family XIII bacterium]|jgi:uncharacterized protein involved in type VI secretion and phage assembly|nr:phage baseplate assembly protein V [Clostridiales Family XIII bacterium]
MALYDIIDEITSRQITKSDTGDPRVQGVVVGIVAKNYSKDMPGRICVTIPTRETEANELQWVRMAQPSGGKKWGHYFLPEIGDQVLLAFENGNIEKPYVIGCIQKDNDQFLSKSVDADNQIKHIMTKNGNELRFEDNKEGEGEKDKITLTTPAKGDKQHMLKLDNENSRIELTDKKGENSIKMRTEDGVIDIKAKSKLTIKVGDKIKLTMNGESGAVTLECSELKVKSSGSVNIKSDGMLKQEAAQMSTSASSVYKLESGGTVIVSGNPIKIG